MKVVTCCIDYSSFKEYEHLGMTERLFLFVRILHNLRVYLLFMLKILQMMWGWGFLFTKTALGVYDEV